MTDRDPGRWRMLVLVSAALLLGMSGWFAGSAAGPELSVRWNLTPTEVGWLTTTVQLGFVAGTALAAILNLADVVSSRVYFAISSALAAIANGLLLIVPGYASALALRFLTGFFLAGVYPPAMKMTATWFRSARGLAIGTVVGALTLGKSTPFLLKTFGETGVDSVIVGTTVAGLGAALLVAAGYRDGPFPFPRRTFSWGLVGSILRHRPTMLATGGYLGHMWELYAMWTWVPAFLVAGAALAGPSAPGATTVEMMGFLAIAAGGLGCVWGGWSADRIGRERVTIWAMGVSGSCALLAGLVFGGNFWILATLACTWGFFVVADSAQFSALVTEVAPAAAVGTALTLQTSLGFLLTMVTIQMVPAIESAAGWRWAFALLALGPAAGIAAMRRLQRLRGARGGAPAT